MTTNLQATCLCKRCDFKASAASDTLPLPVSICHCDSCRHSLGTLFAASCPWPADSFHDLVQSSGQLLTKYSFSSRIDNYFCTNCGSHMFSHTHSRGAERTAVSLGVLRDSDRLVRLDSIEYVADTRDGGASKFIAELDSGARLTLWRRRAGSEKLPFDWPDHATRHSLPGDSLPAHCHCQGVRFRVTRERSGRAYIGGGRPERPEPGEEDAGVSIASPADDRIKASVCACDSCRLGASADLMPWAFVHKRNVWPVACDGYGGGVEDSLADAAPKTGQMRFGALKKYKSSPDVWRYFCGRCGATVFYEDDERPLVLDVALGLFNAESGALGLDWFRWSADYVRNIDDAKNRQLVYGADKGLKRWGQVVGTGYQRPSA